jgi:hypothetical protein
MEEQFNRNLAEVVTRYKFIITGDLNSHRGNSRMECDTVMGHFGETKIMKAKI